MKRIFLLPVLAATAVLAGPYDQPYSQILTEYRNKPADPHVIPVIINRVDDVTMYDKLGTVAPGMHKVTIDVPPRKGFHVATQNEMQLDTKPCTRYYIAARLKSLTLQEWEPFVRYEEPLTDCARKFHLAQGK